MEAREGHTPGNTWPRWKGAQDTLCPWAGGSASTCLCRPMSLSSPGDPGQRVTMCHHVSLRARGLLSTYNLLTLCDGSFWKVFL